jgi:regulatory protein
MNQKITALKRQRRNPDRVNIYLDGEFAFGLSRIVAGWLVVGQELNAEKINLLKTEDEQEVAYQRALKFISHRIRTEDEIRRNLNKHKIPSEVIESVIKRLTRSDLINDVHFARSWVENRNEFRPRAHRILSYELRKKGVAENVILEILESTIPDEELALKAAQKQAHRYKELEWPEFRKKLSGYLARRGFPYNIISLVVEQVWAELKPLDNSSGGSLREVNS